MTVTIGSRVRADFYAEKVTDGPVAFEVRNGQRHLVRRPVRTLVGRVVAMDIKGPKDVVLIVEDEATDEAVRVLPEQVSEVLGVPEEDPRYAHGWGGPAYD